MGLFPLYANNSILTMRIDSMYDDVEFLKTIANLARKTHNDVNRLRSLLNEISVGGVAPEYNLEATTRTVRALRRVRLNAIRSILLS